MTHAVMAEPLLNATEVARLLGISKRSVFNVIGLERVEIPGAGKHPIVRFTPESVRQLIVTRTRKAGV